MNDKVFIGKVITKEFNGPNGKWKKTSISLGPDDFKKLGANRNERGWVNLELKPKKEGGHYMQVDTWKPDNAMAGFSNQKTQDQPGNTSGYSNHPADQDSLPF